MHINVNCSSNKNGAWCNDKRVKRSLFGLGARVCSVFNGKECPFQKSHIRKDLVPIGQKGKS